MEKRTKTEAELAAAIMEELHLRRDCEVVRGVEIAHTEESFEAHPNWGFAWNLEGPETAPPVADEIARRFQEEFDVS